LHCATSDDHQDYLHWILQHSNKLYASTKYLYDHSTICWVFFEVSSYFKFLSTMDVVKNIDQSEFLIRNEKDDFRNVLLDHLIILKFVKYGDRFWSKRYDVSKTSDIFIDFTPKTRTYRYLTTCWTKVIKNHHCEVYFSGKDRSDISMKFGLIILSLLQKLCILEINQ